MHTPMILSECLYSLLSFFAYIALHLASIVPSIPAECYSRGYVSHTDMRVSEPPFIFRYAMLHMN